MSRNRSWSLLLVRSQGTSSFTAIADGVGVGPVTLQPPPLM